MPGSTKFDEGKSALCSPPASSPNGGSSVERNRLYKKFASRLNIEPELSRQLVSFQGNRKRPGLRWFKYKEGFSHALVKRFLEAHPTKSLLDPFAGLGTAPLVAAGQGIRATGIDISPVGVLAARAISHAANGLSKDSLQSHRDELLCAVAAGRAPAKKHFFPHVRITQGAFPNFAEIEIAKARRYLSTLDESNAKCVLQAACMSVLEEVSYTRKDGQYLRWDNRSGRPLRSHMDKGKIPGFFEALQRRLNEIEEDFDELKECYGGSLPTFVTGSSLDVLRKMRAKSFELVVTSPPYANRYDYTRSYALELAWLGYDQPGFSRLRQAMISATVENRSKKDWMCTLYRHTRGKAVNAAISHSRKHPALQEVIKILQDNKHELGNPHVIRLITGYFEEMAVVILELARIVRPGGRVIMVNDNVQYHGEEVPVDLILSDFAEYAGFSCKRIDVLPRGKGNASQQMGRFGRRELRKCVYEWERTNV